MSGDSPPRKRVRVLRARSRGPRREAPPPREDLRTPSQLRAELQRVFPDGVRRAAFCEELRRRLERDDGRGLWTLHGMCYWCEPEESSRPTMSPVLREIWRRVA